MWTTKPKNIYRVAIFKISYRILPGALDNCLPGPVLKQKPSSLDNLDIINR